MQTTTNLPDRFISVLLGKLTLRERLYLRSVSPQWKSVAESMCLEIRTLKIYGVEHKAGLYVRENFQRTFYISSAPQEHRPKACEPSTEGHLIVISTKLTEQFAQMVARLMPNLEHIIVGLDKSCKVASLIYLLTRWPRLTGISLYGQIELSCIVDFAQRRHRVMELIESKANLVRLDLLLCFTQAIAPGIPCNYELPIQLPTVLPRLTRFSIGYHDKATFGTALFKLGPQCSYLAIEDFDIDSNKLKLLRCVDKLTYLKVKSSVDHPELLPLICTRFKALQTLHLSIKQVTLDTHLIGLLSLLSNLTTLCIDNVLDIAIDVDAKDQDPFEPLTQVKNLKMFEGKLVSDPNGRNGDLICRTLGSVFPRVESLTFSRNFSLLFRAKMMEKNFPLLKAIDFTYKQ